MYMKIIICFPKILRNSHREIFGLDFLISKGYDVVLLDLMKIHGGKSTCDDRLMLSLTKQCDSYEEIDSFVKSLDPESVIYLCNDGYLTSAYGSIGKLRRKQDKLLAFKTKTIPSQHKKSNKIRRILEKIVKSSTHSFHYFDFLYKQKNNSVIPDYYMCSTNYDLPLKTILTVKRKNIIIAHSDDVNKIIQDNSKADITRKTGVFLDQVIPISLMKDVPKDYFDSYYNSLRISLNNLKVQLNLDEIIIAEHPGSNTYSDRLENKFGDFKRFQGNTEVLIKNASYVFAHFSTAIGFAVYHKKPIILLTDNVMLNIESVVLGVNSFVNSLKIPTIHMNKEIIIKKEYSIINEKAYNDYVRKFMRENVIDENSYYYAIKQISRDILNLNYK